MSRPDYVKCIAETHQDRIGLSLCGRTIGRVIVITDNSDPHIGPRELKELRAFEFCFLNIDHWFHVAAQGGYLLLCAECASKLKGALKTQVWKK